MAEDSDGQVPFNYFARVDDAIFWNDRARVKTLIDLYQHYECLWNSRCADYKNLTRKRRAKEEIGEHFGWSGDEAWAKMESLRDQRTRWDRRIKETANSAGRGNDEFARLKPIWWFDLLSFLTKDSLPANPILDTAASSMDADASSEHSQNGAVGYFSALAASSESHEVPKKKRPRTTSTAAARKLHLSPKAVERLTESRRITNDDISHVHSVSNYVASTATTERRVDRAGSSAGPAVADAEELFGQYIAAEVRKLPNELIKQIVKNEMQNVVLKAHLGFYHNSPGGANVPSTHGLFSGFNVSISPHQSAMPTIMPGYSAAYIPTRDASMLNGTSNVSHVNPRLQASAQPNSAGSSSSSGGGGSFVLKVEADDDTED